MPDFPELHGTWALDLETYDPQLQTHGPGWCFPNGNIVGVAVSWDEGRCAEYYPVRHRGWEGGNLNPLEVFAWLEAQLVKPTSEVIFHERLYDAGWLRAESVPFKCRAQDTAVAAPLIDEYRDSYGLDALAKDYTSERKDTRLLEAYAKGKGWHPKKDLWRMPADIVVPYGRQDARATLLLWQALKPLLDKDNLWDVYNLEIALQPLWLEMRRRGVRVDQEQAERVKTQLSCRERDLQKMLCDLSGVRLASPWAPNPIAEACRKLGIAFGRTSEGAPSFTKYTLRQHAHPFMKGLAEWREINKLRTTFIEGHVLGHAVNGRIHAEFNPLRKGDKDDPTGIGGTVTGRASSSNPNLQQLPNPKRNPERYEEAKLIKKVFLPEVGEQWGALDYSQQEPRLVIHFADLCHLAGVSKMVDQYHADPATDFHRTLAKLTEDVQHSLGLTFDVWRAITKNFGLGVIYGMGGPKLCRSIGKPTKMIEKRDREGNVYMKEVAGDEGQQIMDKFNASAPFIRELDELCKRRARQRGWIRTLGGRLCRFDRERGWHDAHLGGASIHKALNRLIQGSAADQTKMAMLHAWQQLGVVPLVVVHDEKGISGNTELFRKVKHCMEHAVELRIPSLVDVKAAGSWGDTL